MQRNISREYIMGFVKEADAHGIDPTYLMKVAEWEWWKNLKDTFRTAREAWKHRDTLKFMMNNPLMKVYTKAHELWSGLDKHGQRAILGGLGVGLGNILLSPWKEGDTLLGKALGGLAAGGLGGLATYGVSKGIDAFNNSKAEAGSNAALKEEVDNAVRTQTSQMD